MQGEVTGKTRPSHSDLVVVGGCGHVGLPLGASFASKGLSVIALDRDQTAVRKVMSGHAPFYEPGLDDLISSTIASGRFYATDDPSVVSLSKYVVVVLGTPVDEFLAPSTSSFLRVISNLLAEMREDQVMILRSTLAPGTCKAITRLVQESGKEIQLSYCPERIAEGYALEELGTLPQIVSGSTDEALNASVELFGLLAPTVIELSLEEAEFAKLLTNSWRYLKFAIANQFFSLVEEAGVNYASVYAAVTNDYPRAQDLPRPGFAAGPCLLKDTMQLAASRPESFQLGLMAVSSNESLPNVVVDSLRSQFDLSRVNVGILGMAFKPNSDDTRSSLAFKLKRLLEFEGSRVRVHDPFVKGLNSPHELELILESSDFIIFGAKHSYYDDIRPVCPTLDLPSRLTTLNLSRPDVFK